MLETNIIIQISKIQRQSLLKFGNQESKIKTVLDLGLWSQLNLVEHSMFVLFIINLLSKEYFWLREHWKNVYKIFIENLRLLKNEFLYLLAIDIL